jgi:hypothetical protein
MIESWDDLKLFLGYLFQLGVMMAIVLAIVVACGMGYVTLFPPAPYVFDTPAPLDVCPNTQVASVIREETISVNYINQRGDTIYLLYTAQRGAPAIFQSQQVIDGDDCPQ